MKKFRYYWRLFVSKLTGRPAPIAHDPIETRDDERDVYSYTTPTTQSPKLGTRAYTHRLHYQRHARRLVNLEPLRVAHGMLKDVQQ
jgi:hypothetical protein